MNIRKNKRGWITVLEATIAVLLISGVLLIVYSRQGTGDSSAIDEYILNYQKQVLGDISGNSILRLHALDRNETALNEYAATKIPTAYRFSVQICPLGDHSDYCNLNASEVSETREKELFTDEIIISSELDPDDPLASVYDPVKVRLYIWENR